MFTAIHPQCRDFVCILKQLTDEVAADLTAIKKEKLDLRTKHQVSVKAKTEEISVMTSTIEEKTVQQVGLVTLLASQELGPVGRQLRSSSPLSGRIDRDSESPSR